MDTRSTPKPRPLRAKLYAKGYTYASFASKFGFKERTVKAAVRGERGGKKSQAVATAIRAL